jgi:hypothetical protein
VATDIPNHIARSTTPSGVRPAASIVENGERQVPPGTIRHKGMQFAVRVVEKNQHLPRRVQTTSAQETTYIVPDIEKPASHHRVGNMSHPMSAKHSGAPWPLAMIENIFNGLGHNMAQWEASRKKQEKIDKIKHAKFEKLEHAMAKHNRIAFAKLKIIDREIAENEAHGQALLVKRHHVDPDDQIPDTTRRHSWPFY